MGEGVGASQTRAGSFRVQGYSDYDLSQRKGVRDDGNVTLTPLWSPALSTSAEPRAEHKCMLVSITGNLLRLTSKPCVRRPFQLPGHERAERRS